MKKLLTCFCAMLFAVCFMTVCHAAAPPPPATTTILTSPVQYNTELPVVAPVVSSIPCVSPSNLPQVIPLCNYLMPQCQYNAITVSFAMLGSPLMVAAPNVQAVRVNKSEMYATAIIQDDHPQSPMTQTDPSLIKAAEQKE